MVNSSSHNRFTSSINRVGEVTPTVDTLLIRLAENAFKAGLPMELWAAMVCEAKGLDHNLPQTFEELKQAVLDDVAVTHRTMNKVDSGDVSSANRFKPNSPIATMARVA